MTINQQEPDFLDQKVAIICHERYSTRYDVAAGIRCYEVLDGMGVAERINKKAIYRLGARMLF